MISVTILTKNSEKCLPKVLTALLGFDEVVVYDNGSNDATIQIAKQFPNVVVHQGEFLGFGKTHNAATACASHDWILSIDSDEVVTPELAHEIASTHLDPEKIYSFQRRNYFNGKWIRGCGWSPDRVNRLYHRKYTRFTDAEVHEDLIAEGREIVELKSALIHYSYDSLSDFLHKMQIYSTLFAKQYKGKRPSSLAKAIGKGFFTFFKSYVLKRGFLDGYEGFVISVYNGNTAFYKYLKLRELNERCQNSPVARGEGEPQ